MTELERAVRYLQSRNSVAARQVLAAARAAGDLDAALTEIALTANGTGAEPDWPGAVALLREAALRHGGQAARDMALIHAMNLDDAGKPLNLPEGEILSRMPHVRRFPKLLSPQECQCLAESVAGILQPAEVTDPRSGERIAHPVRTSSTAPIGPTRQSLPIQAILSRIAALVRVEVAQGEPLTVLHYAPGQQYRPHLDALPHTSNQRIATVLLYLNEGYGGGETRFDHNGLTVCGRGGDVLWFANTLPDGRPDPATRHAGLPVTSGSKWLATWWIRSFPFDVWEGPETVLPSK